MPHLLRIARTSCGCVRGMSKREWSASDQKQMHNNEASKKRSGHLIAVLEHHREVICTIRFSKCEPVEEDEHYQKLPARREVPCASPPVDEDDNVTKKKGKKKANKKAKKKAMSLLSVVGAKITEEQLSAQDPSNIPEDWNTPGKYHPACVAIWTAWLNFVPVFLDKQTNDGSDLHLVPLLLPWNALHDSSVIVLLMHYMPTQLTNSVKVDFHPGKFFSALQDSFQTCCHPEFLLNERYQNEHTERYAKLWDEIYSEIRSYFGNPDKCIEGNNIVMKVDGSVSFELLKKAAEEKNARTSKRLRIWLKEANIPGSNQSSFMHTASIPVSE